jgi:hypothetical protein
MLNPLQIVLLALLIVLGGCAEFDAWTSSLSKPSAPAAATDQVVRADVTYINSTAGVLTRDFRNIYIAPANLANMQVIQPEGGSADIEWWVTDTEDQVLQRTLADEFAAALGKQAAFFTVATPEEAQLVVHTAVVAIHPNVSRAAVAASTSTGGAITVSITVVNAVSNEVLVRVVDTQSIDDVWAFNQVDSGDPALSGIFHSWGEGIRLGVLQLQGRSDGQVITH